MRQGRPVLLEVLFVQCVTELFQERVTRPNISAWMKEESLYKCSGQVTDLVSPLGEHVTLFG